MFAIAHGLRSQSGKGLAIFANGTQPSASQRERKPFHSSAITACSTSRNAEDILPDKIPVLNGSQREHSPITEAESIVAAMPKKPEIRHGGGRACYSPSLDCVTLPMPEHFQSGQDYYSVLFHELTHSTGHASRLNRNGVSGSDGEWSAFGSTPYAREELVAEMGAAFLSGQAGIVERTLDNSAAYIQSWLARLKEDRRLIVQAAAQAQKAADFILGRKFDEPGTEEGK